MPDNPKQSPASRPGDGFLGWLGRQVGYVSKAIKTDVTAPLPPVPSPVEPSVVYRTGKVEEVPHPTEPGVVLRRTVVDEVVVTKRDDPK